MNIKSQEKAFNKIIQWLTEQHLKLENLRRFSDPNSEVKLLENRDEFIKIIIADQTQESVLIQATVNFDKDTVNSFNLTPSKFKEQLFQKISM